MYKKFCDLCDNIVVYSWTLEMHHPVVAERYHLDLCAECAEPFLTLLRSKDDE